MKINQIQQWIRNIRYRIGLRLLHREAKDVHSALWEIMSCRLSDLQISPPQIELSVEGGHNQIVQINNGVELSHEIYRSSFNRTNAC